MQTRAIFNRDLAALDEDVVAMGNQVSNALDRAMDALHDHNQELAHEVVAGDQQINDMRFKIEEKCLHLIASQQPVARDLRQIIAAMNISMDLERIADHAEGIAKIVLRAAGEPTWQLPVNIIRMLANTQEMLKRSLQAYLDRDNEAAQRVCQQDDEVDHLYKQLFNELLLMMIADPRTVTKGTYLLWAGHNLERAADRVTNIGERVIFAMTGEMRERNV